jgi:hypothetical protein
MESIHQPLTGARDRRCLAQSNQHTVHNLHVGRAAGFVGGHTHVLAAVEHAVELEVHIRGELQGARPVAEPGIGRCIIIEPGHNTVLITVHITLVEEVGHVESDDAIGPGIHLIGGPLDVVSIEHRLAGLDPVRAVRGVILVLTHAVIELHGRDDITVLRRDVDGEIPHGILTRIGVRVGIGVGIRIGIGVRIGVAVGVGVCLKGSVIGRVFDTEIPTGRGAQGAGRKGEKGKNQNTHGISCQQRWT